MAELKTIITVYKKETGLSDLIASGNGFPYLLFCDQGVSANSEIVIGDHKKRKEIKVKKNDSVHHKRCSWVRCFFLRLSIVEHHELPMKEKTRDFLIKGPTPSTFTVNTRD